MNFGKTQYYMHLTEEQCNHIEQLAAINYSPKQIALYLGNDEKEFLKEFHKDNSKIKLHYDRGSLMAQAEIDQANLKRARDGSLTAIQQWKKDARHQRFENLKLKLLYDKEKSNYAHLQQYIETGNTDNLPKKLVDYYEQIEFIRSLYNKYHSRPYIAETVHLQWKNISKDKILELINETIQFFNLDNSLKGEDWGQIYADKLDTLASLSIEMSDLETARKCLKDAAYLRGAGKEQTNQIPHELLDRRPILYTIRLKDLGFPEINRKELNVFIDNLDISEKEKSRVKREALIESTPFETIPNAPE